MRFEPVRTDLVQVRPVRPSDLDAFVERRNDPVVAEYQDWLLPYGRERAEGWFAALAEVDGPVDGDWWMATVTDPDDSVIYGDVVLNLTNASRTAEIGYTFAAAHWGRGYATHACQAVVDFLFDVVGVSRVGATLHPDNLASAMLLERLGMRFEGEQPLAHWRGDENTDNWIYGMTRADFETWRARPTGPPDTVELVEITPDNDRAVAALRTHKTQERLVSTMAVSFRNALFPEVWNGAPVVPWLRAVRADGQLAGFVMLALTTEHHRRPYLWRLLIDAHHQRRGIGRRVLDLVVEQCRQWGDTALEVSWEEGRGSPRPFYEAYGFVPTGQIIDGETEAVLTL